MASTDPQSHTSGTPSTNITLAQRRCLSHVIRNILESLGASLTLIENDSSNFTPEELRSCISNPAKLLERMNNALSNRSFCTLEKEECKWIGKYCGCNTTPK